MIINKKNKLGAIAISQTLLLILGIVAFAFMIGSSIEVVSAGGDDSACISLGGLCHTYSYAPIGGESCDAVTNSGIVNGLIELEKCSGDKFHVCCVPIITPNTDEPNTQSEQSSSPIPLDAPEEKKDFTAKEFTNALGTGIAAIGSTKTVLDLFKKKVADGTIKAGGSLPKEEITNALMSDSSSPYFVGPPEAPSVPELQAPKNNILTYFTKGFQGSAVKDSAGTITKISSTPKGFGAVVGNAFNTLAVAFGAAQLVILAANLLGAGERNMQSIKASAYTSAAIAAVASIALTQAGVVIAASATAGPPVWMVAAVVVVATVIYTAFTYQEFSQEVFTYQPQVWKPQDGGQDCELCNDFKYGCSEYQCHALGNSCDIINEGTQDEKCVWINEKDILPPELTPLESALKSEDYMYIDSTAVLPGERGAKVVYKPNNNGCVLPFTSVAFGVESNEPAECMIDVVRKNNLSDMTSYMAQGPVSVYNHSLEIPASGMPSQEALEGIGWELETSKNYTFFIRCKDTNGNPTTANFLIEFCVDDGPDTQAPIIEGTNYLQESYIGFNTSDVPLEVYTNEPANCRWDFQDLDYEAMDNEMEDCSQNLNDYFVLNTFTYGCSSTLTGIQEGVDNEFYIKCKDKPWLAGVNETIGKRFSNKDPYILNLKGTYPVQIDEVTINNEFSGATIIDSTNTIKATLKVKTSAGANEGKTKCQYGIDGNFYDFYNAGNYEFLYENTQDFFLPQGFYNYEVKCIDEAGNSAKDLINFTIEIDEQAPIVTRIYYEEEFLKLVTNEDGTCVFGTDTCNYAYEDGIQMNDLNGFNHYVEWNTDVDLYIKCKDLFGNLPLPQEKCSIIARAFNEQGY